MSQLLKLAQALGLASLVASAAHNPAEYFIPPLGPRFMGHFYDRTPDSCYPSGDAVHVVYIAAGEAAQSRLLQFTAQIADMSKKGYFNDQIYLHFVVDKDNQAVIKEWRSNFENLDGHRPRHVVSSDPPISASVDGMSLEVRPSICGVFHHFEHMCSHARLSTRLPLSEDEPNTPGEMAFREQRCRHSYRNIMQYFQTVGADLLDPPRFIVLVNGWHSLLLDTAMLKAAASMLTGEQPVGLHTQARSGASLSEALACGHIVDDCLCMSPAAVNTSFICDPLDDFMLLSFENATALIALEALVRDQPLEIDFMNLLWRRAGNKYYTILPSHLRHRVQPLMHYRHGTVSQSVGLDGEFNYRYQSPGSNSAFVLEDRGFSSEPSSDASIWCPDLNPEATHPHQSVGRQWVGGDNGRFCLVVTPIEKLSKGRVEESNKESVEESSEGADVDGGQIAANPFIAILDNGILGACASTRLSELNYMNWLLLTSYEACDEISACETVGLQWQGSTADREVDNSSIMQWMVYSSVLEESILPVAPDTGTTDGTRNGAKNYFSLLLDRLLPSSMWRFDKYSESFWSSSPVNNLTMERYLMKRRATLTAEPISINLSRRARLRRPLANITASVGAMDTGIWDVLYTSLNKDRIVGMDNRPLPVSRAIKQEKVLILGEDQAYSLKYDKLISGIPRLHLDNLFTETVAMPDKLNFRDNSSQSVIMVRVSILEMLLCGEVYSRFHRLPKGDVVSALRFDGSDVIFNKVTIDRKPFIDKYFVAASQKCPQNELYKLSAEVSSSDTTLIPREDLALVQAIDSSLTLVGLLIPTGGSHQVVHRYKLRHFEIPVAQPLSSISEQSSERIVAPLSSSVLHSGLNGGIDVGCGPDPRCGQAEAACLAGVRLAEEALVGDRAQITRVEALSTRDRDLVLRELLKQMPHALQPDPSGPTIITVSAPVIELATYTHSKTEDDFFDKATSAEQAKRKSILRIKEKQRRFIPDRRLAVAVSAMSLRVFGWGLFQVNSLVVHSGWATDSPPEADESIEDGDYHIVRPNLWSGLQLGALASAIHPSALALLAHLTYIVDRYADLPDIVIFSEPSLPTDLWLLRDEEIDTQEILNLPLRDNMKLSPHIGIYADIFDTENIQIAGIIEAAISFSFSMEDNWIDSWRLFCNLHQSSTAMLCRPNNPYLFYASRALIQASNRSFYLKLLNDLKEASSRDIAYGALTFGADAGYLLALLLAGTARACQIQPGQNPDLLAPTILWPTLNQSYFYLSPSLCAESPFHTDVSSFIVKVFPLILQSGRDKISEVIFDSIFDKHMAATARPRLRADDMQALKNKALTVYVYDLPPRFHRHWLDMGTTILCWQDHPWDRSPCEFLKGPHRSMWPRQTVVCSDGDPTKQSLNGTSVRSCIVQDLPESSHEMFSRSYHLSPYRTIDPAGEILMLMRLLLSLRFVTVTEHADRADLFIMPYLASSASFFSRNVKATPPLSDGKHAYNFAEYNNNNKI